MKPIILIPGIEATTLVDANSFDFDVKWNAFDTIFTALGTKVRGPYIEDKLQLNPLYDEHSGRIIERNHMARLPYEKTIQNIASKFNDPIYLFGYDWRLSNSVNGKRLALFVNYLKEKLKGKDVQGFRFITHSMGGLVFSCYLTELNGNYSDIDKVIMCAPPLRGSPYAVIHLVRGDGGVKSFLNRIFGRDADIRKVIRTYPALLELSPWYTNCMSYEDNTAVDLLQLSNWQSNIYDDIKELFDARVKALADFRKKQMFDLASLPQELRARMIIVAGSQDKTVVKLNILKEKDGIQSYVQFDKIENGSGDGTVPFASSTIYKDSIRTIEVQKEGILSEPGDNMDFHGLFLRDSRVQNIVIRMLDEKVKSTRISDSEANAYFGKPNRNWWESIGDSVKSLSDFG